MDYTAGQATPGPWELYRSEDEYGEMVHAVTKFGIGPNGGHVAWNLARMPVTSESKRLTQDEINANARLMRASPDMLEALLLFEKQWNACGPNSDFGRYFSNVRDAVVSAIARATAAQTDNAIAKLATLADQTKRQADATSGQLGFLKQQVAEAKAQTKAISDQTTAIKRSAISAIQSAQALVQSADAQTKAANAATIAANAAAAAERPGIAITDATMHGLKGEPRKDGTVDVTFNYQFTNIGGSPWTMIDNAQTIIVEKELPPIPDYSKAYHFKGDGLVIPKGQFAHLMEDIHLGITKEQAIDINARTRFVFVYGIFTYGVFGTEHKYCYAFMLPIVDGNSTRFIEAGSAAYHCDT